MAAIELIAKTNRTGQASSPWVAVPRAARRMSFELDSDNYATRDQEIRVSAFGRIGQGRSVFLGGGGYHGGLTRERTNKLTRQVETTPWGPRRLHIDFLDADALPDEVMIEVDVSGDLVCGWTLTFSPEI